jgi:hypothetical protein
MSDRITTCCNHRFERDFLVEWLKTCDTCPKCKKVIKNGDYDYILIGKKVFGIRSNVGRKLIITEKDEITEKIINDIFIKKNLPQEDSVAKKIIILENINEYQNLNIYW